MKQYRVRLSADNDDVQSERVIVPVQPRHTTKPFKKPKRGKAIALRRGLHVCMTWDKNYRGTITEVGLEVSGMVREGFNKHDIFYHSNEQYRVWNEGGDDVE